MGTWTKEVTLDPIDFDGDKITFTATRLLVDDMAQILTHYVPEKQTLVFSGGNAEMAKEASALFPKYVTSIAGMTKSDGSQFSLAEFVEVTKEFYFAPLVSQLFGQLMKISSVGKDAKNSEPPSPVV